MLNGNFDYRLRIKQYYYFQVRSLHYDGEGFARVLYLWPMSGGKILWSCVPTTRLALPQEDLQREEETLSTVP